MRHLILATLLGFWAISSAAQDLPKADVQGVIDGQIAAFRSDDVDRAFSFASPMIQGMFGTSSNFGAMVQRGYPMVWRPADVRYGVLSKRDGTLYQTVFLTDQAGKVHAFEYEMVAGESGFKINGVWPIPLPEVGA